MHTGDEQTVDTKKNKYAYNAAKNSRQMQCTPLQRHWKLHLQATSKECVLPNTASRHCLPLTIEQQTTHPVQATQPLHSHKH